MPDSNFIFLVCEGPSDARAAKGFGEKVILEHCAWLEPEEYRPRWQGISSGETYLAWKDVKDALRVFNLRSRHGHFDGEIIKPDAVSARNALQIATELNPVAVVFCRDQDNDSERKAGLEQARKDHPKTDFQVAIGFANPCTEAWILAGFIPRTKIETENLERIEKAHPRLTREPHTLTNRPLQKEHVKTLAPPLERESHSWRETLLEDLHLRGSGCGLSEYLDEISQNVVPAFRSSRAK